MEKPFKFIKLEGFFRLPKMLYMEQNVLVERKSLEPFP